MSGVCSELIIQRLAWMSELCQSIYPLEESLLDLRVNMPLGRVQLQGRSRAVQSQGREQ